MADHEEGPSQLQTRTHPWAALTEEGHTSHTGENMDCGIFPLGVCKGLPGSIGKTSRRLSTNNRQEICGLQGVAGLHGLVAGIHCTMIELASHVAS